MTGGITPARQAAALSAVLAAGLPDLSVCRHTLRLVEDERARLRTQHANPQALGRDAASASDVCGGAAEALAQMDTPTNALAQSAIVLLHGAMDEANTASQYYVVAADYIAEDGNAGIVGGDDLVTGGDER